MSNASAALPRAGTLVAATARIKIRALHGGDVDSLQSLFAVHDIAQALFDGTPGEAGLKSLARYHLRAMMAGAGQTWVLVDVDEPAALLGYIGILHGLVAYAVRPEQRRRGLASMMLRHGCAVFADEAAYVLRASVMRQNAASACLLERHGFRFTGFGVSTAIGTMRTVRTLDYELRGERGQKEEKESGGQV